MTDSLECRIWRCVDRELDAQEQQALLRELDHRDDGWRQLSLALLEDRTVSDACQDDHAQEPDPPSDLSKTAAQPSSMRIPGAPLLATAAGLLVLIGASFVAGRWSSERTVAGEPIAEDIIHSGKPGTELETEDDTGLVLMAGVDDQTPLERPQLLLELDLGGGQIESVPVSVLSSAEWQGRPTTNTPPLLPNRMRQSLQQSGYAIDEQQQLMVLPLDDGRHLTMPVETILVRESL